MIKFKNKKALDNYTEKINRFQDNDICFCEEENKSFLKIPKNKNPYPFVYDIDKMAKEIERKGFVFVCDCSDAKSISNMIKIIDKQLEIEKTTNVSIHKIILFNKSDKIVNEKEFKAKRKEIKVERKDNKASENSMLNKYIKEYVSKKKKNKSESRSESKKEHKHHKHHHHHRRERSRSNK